MNKKHEIPYKTLHRICTRRKVIGKLIKKLMTKEEEKLLDGAISVTWSGLGVELMKTKSEKTNLPVLQEAYIDLYAKPLERNNLLPLTTFEKIYYSIFPGSYIKKIRSKI